MSFRDRILQQSNLQLTIFSAYATYLRTFSLNSELGNAVNTKLVQYRDIKYLLYKIHIVTMHF